MKKPMVRIKTGSGIDEFIDREMNDAEFTQYEIDQAENATKQAELQAEAETKAVKRAELLSRLGITEEEARILLG